MRSSIWTKNNRFMFFAGWGHHFHYVKKDGSVYGAGRDDYGQLGRFLKGEKVDRTRNVFTPIKIRFFQRTGKMSIVDISIGDDHTVFQTEDKLYAAGRNDWGMLSVEDNEKRFYPTPIKLRDPEENIRVRKGYASGSSTYVLTETGNCYAGGYNAFGELCFGDKHHRNLAELIPLCRDSGVKIAAVGAGWYNVVLLSVSGDVYYAGKNVGEHNIFGLRGDFSSGRLPFKIPDSDIPTRISQVCVIFTSFYLIDDNGRVYCCGDTRKGQFGETREALNEAIKTERRGWPYLSPVIKNVDFMVGENDRFVIWMTKSKEIFGVGNNESKVISNNREKIIMKPTKIKGLGGKVISQICCGFDTAYYITAKGTVYAQGASDAGQYGKDLPHSVERGLLMKLDNITDLKIQSRYCSSFEEKRERLGFMLNRFGSNITKGLFSLVYHHKE